jgi:putative transposase
MTDNIEAMTPHVDEQELAEQLVEQARADGVELIGPGVLLTGLTSKVINTALEVEMAEHLGYDRHDPAGRNGENSRNGARTKTVLTELGPVRSTSRGTATGASNRRPCVSGSAGWTGLMRSCCHCRPAG